jgi:hypothetical protein
MTPSEKREAAILEARQRWDEAPFTIKTMASAYVGPLLNALDAIGSELDELKPKFTGGLSHE